MVNNYYAMVNTYYTMVHYSESESYSATLKDEYYAEAFKTCRVKLETEFGDGSFEGIKTI